MFQNQNQKLFTLTPSQTAPTLDVERGGHILGVFRNLPTRPLSKVYERLVNMHSKATRWKTLLTVLCVPTMRTYLHTRRRSRGCVVQEEGQHFAHLCQSHWLDLNWGMFACRVLYATQAMLLIIVQKQHTPCNKGIAYYNRKKCISNFLGDLT